MKRHNICQRVLTGKADRGRCINGYRKGTVMVINDGTKPAGGIYRDAQRHIQATARETALQPVGLNRR